MVELLDIVKNCVCKVRERILLGEICSMPKIMRTFSCPGTSLQSWYENFVLYSLSEDLSESEWLAFTSVENQMSIFNDSQSFGIAV